MPGTSQVGQDALVHDSPDSNRGSLRVAELIQLGRDLEAAQLAVALSPSMDHAQAQIGGEPMEVLDQFDELGPLLMSVVGEINPDQLDNPTPCETFTVRGVLEHMIGGATTFAAAFSGAEPAAADLDNVLTGFGPALGGLGEAVHSAGALDRTIAAPFGELPGSEFARFVVLDGLVHGWDLATATGQRYDPPDALVAAADAYAREAIDTLRDGDTFASAIEPPPSATPIERLAAFTGRALPSR
jgi:uncharacterized protein (TIGR03086 family)